MAATITALVDGLALITNANQELNQRRREGHKADINVTYKGLCNNDTGTSSLLYRYNLSTRISEINETNRVASKLTAVNAESFRTATTPVFDVDAGYNELDGALPWSFFRGGFHLNYDGKPFLKRGQHARPTARPAQRSRDT